MFWSLDLVDLLLLCRGDFAPNDGVVLVIVVPEDRGGLVQVLRGLSVVPAAAPRPLTPALRGFLGVDRAGPGRALAAMPVQL